MAWELAGRLLFPNWDVSYAIYGARFWMDRGSAWMNVWPGIDLLLGQLANMFGEPEAAVAIALKIQASSGWVWLAGSSTKEAIKLGRQSLAPIGAFIPRSLRPRASNILVENILNS